MKYLFVLFLGFLSSSCTMKNDATKVAEKFCNCSDSIMKNNSDVHKRNIELEDCFQLVLNEIQNHSNDSVSRYHFGLNVSNMIKTNCANWPTIEKNYKTKTQTSEVLKREPRKCREFFVDGEYEILGNNVPMKIIRKGNENISRRTDIGCETKFEIQWIDDCTYNLISKSTNCVDERHLMGDTILVRVVEIKYDTVHYELEAHSFTFPQIMRKITK